MDNFKITFLYFFHIFDSIKIKPNQTLDVK